MFIDVFPRFVFFSRIFCFCFIIFLLIYLFIRPILAYNSEIWFVDDYFSISRAISRSEQSGSVCDTLSLENNFFYEKIHNKFFEYILGLKKTACNISAKSELRRFSITDFI